MDNLAGSIRRDDVSEVLNSVRFRGALFCRSELSAPWGFSVAGREFASFHIVTRGRCCLDVDGLEERFWLAEGDLVVLPTGRAHTVRDSASSPATRLEELVAEGRAAARDTLRIGGGGAETVLLCGGFHWEDRATSPIEALLPPIIHLQGRTHGVDTCRMNKATGVLRSTDATIADVAERSGYDSEASFCRAFKRFLGRSPADFRSTRNGPTRNLNGASSTVGTQPNIVRTDC
jgi:hypothetical protein